MNTPWVVAMPNWPRGEAEIEELLRRHELEAVTGATADGTSYLQQARRTVITAESLIGTDAYSAYVLTYDAA